MGWPHMHARSSTRCPAARRPVWRCSVSSESSEALERALDGFLGTVLAVSHDRTFLRGLDRFILVNDDGEVFSLPDYEVAMAALAAPDQVGTLRLAKPLTS